MTNSDRPAGLIPPWLYGPPWVPCPCCENWVCRIHGSHAHDCECPPVDEWEAAGSSPYIAAPAPVAYDPLP